MDGSFQPCGKERAFQIGSQGAYAVNKKIFKTSNPAALESLAMNMSCNLLGIGGAATPYAVKAIAELEKDKNDWAQKLLFVINATSVQLLPTTGYRASRKRRQRKCVRYIFALADMHLHFDGACRCALYFREKNMALIIPVVFIVVFCVCYI